MSRAKIHLNEDIEGSYNDLLWNIYLARGCNGDSGRGFNLFTNT